MTLLNGLFIGFSQALISPYTTSTKVPVITTTNQSPSFWMTTTTGTRTGTKTTRCYESENPIKGDPIREATGIRPSLHPTTINAIADALKARAKNNDNIDNNDDDGMVFRTSETVSPLDVAITAGKIATSAIAKRQKASEEDGMKLTSKEEQTIAGRVLGVIMRFDELEDMLLQRVSTVDWIDTYNEWNTFGTIKKITTTTDDDSNDEKKTYEMSLNEKIIDDPFFTICRAECLLALFLQTIEIPQLQKVNESVPDDSTIDFLDEDRAEVLLHSE